MDRNARTISSGLGGRIQRNTQVERQRGTKAREEVLTAALERLQSLPFTVDLERNLTIMQELFRKCGDAIFRRFEVGGQIPAVVVFMDGMVVSERLENAVLKPLLFSDAPAGPSEGKHLAASTVWPLHTVGDAVSAVLGGSRRFSIWEAMPPDLPSLLSKGLRTELGVWATLMALALYVALSVLFRWPRFSPVIVARFITEPVSALFGVK